MVGYMHQVYATGYGLARRGEQIPSNIPTSVRVFNLFHHLPYFGINRDRALPWHIQEFDHALRRIHRIHDRDFASPQCPTRSGWIEWPAFKGEWTYPLAEYGRACGLLYPKGLFDDLIFVIELQRPLFMIE